jgi:hypothetical protein
VRWHSRTGPERKMRLVLASYPWVRPVLHRTAVIAAAHSALRLCAHPIHRLMLSGKLRKGGAIESKNGYSVGDNRRCNRHCDWLRSCKFERGRFIRLHVVGWIENRRIRSWRRCSGLDYRGCHCWNGGSVPLASKFKLRHYLNLPSGWHGAWRPSNMGADRRTRSIQIHK